MKNNYLTPETSAFSFDFIEGMMTNISNTGSSTNLTVTESTDDDDWNY